MTDSAYHAQLQRQLRERDQQIRALEDEVAAWRRQGRRADRYRAAWQNARRRAQAYGEGILRHCAERDQVYAWLRAAEAALAAIHEGEEPYEDKRVVPTPGQWIWRWNRATPAERLSRAQRILADWAQVTHCTWEHSDLLDRADRAEALAGIAESRADDWRQAHRRQVSETLRATSRAEQAEARIAAVRALADELDNEEAYGGLADGYQNAAGRIRDALDGGTPALAKPAWSGCPGCLWPAHDGITCQENLAVLRSADATEPTS